VNIHIICLGSPESHLLVPTNPHIDTPESVDEEQHIHVHIFRTCNIHTSKFKHSILWMWPHWVWPSWKLTSRLKIDGWKMKFPFKQMVSLSVDMLIFAGGYILQQEESLRLLKACVMSWSVPDRFIMSILRGRCGMVNYRPVLNLINSKAFPGWKLTRLTKGF